MHHRSSKRFWSLLVILSVGLLAAGCGGTSVDYDDTRPEDEQNAKPQPLNEKVFVTVEDVAQLREEGALIFDARALEDYEAGHVPGALHVNGGKEFQDDLGLVVDDVVALQETARSLGLSRDKKIVVYGNERSKRAGRLFWTLEYLGHGETYFFTEGYEALLAGLGEEAQLETVTPEPGDFVVALRPEVRATSQEVLDAAEGRASAILIDTRRLEEYEGTEDRGDPRQGYIPEAVYYYWEDVYTPEGLLRTRDELKQEFEANQMLKDDAVIIPYCQTGVRSATVYAVFRWLGHKNVKNYDGSWVEWSRDENLPIAHIDPSSDSQ